MLPFRIVWISAVAFKSRRHSDASSGCVIDYLMLPYVEPLSAPAYADDN